MRRHPPKVSRKKLKAKIEGLRAIIALNNIACQLQISAIIANREVRCLEGGVVPNGVPGETVLANTSAHAIPAHLVEELEKTGDNIKVIIGRHEKPHTGGSYER